MARVRNYAEEYRRRLENEQARAVMEGREFSKAKARGHVSAEYERGQQATYRQVKREQRRAEGQGPPLGPSSKASLETWIRRTTFGLEFQDYHDTVYRAVDILADIRGSQAEGRRWMIERLKKKYEDTLEFMGLMAEGMTQENAGPGSTGHQHYAQGRLEFMPVEVYWYHGGGT